MAPYTGSFEWSGCFRPVTNSLLPGDKISLPASALEQLLAAAPVVSGDAQTSRSSLTGFDPLNPYSFAAERHSRALSQLSQQQLPYPLMFRLVNISNNRMVHAGIREFSAEEETAGLSPFLANALGVSQAISSQQPVNQDNASFLPGVGDSLIKVQIKDIPKGTFVKLRPMEAGYNPEDWKSLLEEYMRKNYTTLSRGEILTVPSGQEHYQFLIDELKPKGDAICVVDTDLEVDIEALNEEQARETLRRMAKGSITAKGSDGYSSKGGTLSLLKLERGQVFDGGYVDYELPSWLRSSWLEIELCPSNDEYELDLFASPFNQHQRAKPRLDDHVFGDFEGQGSKRLRLSPNNIELENADTLWISVHAPYVNLPEHEPRHFSIRASPVEKATVDNRSTEGADPNVDNEVICSNCHKSISKQSLVLHENFCRRNNVLCPEGCGTVLQRSSSSWSSHWHCPHDASYGNTQASFDRHQYVHHTEHVCPSPNCNFIAPTIPALAQHRTSTCPGKLILCSFCHLVVPQEGDPDGKPNAEALLSGLTPHELADGSRTTDCYLCSRIVRLRDMSTHMKHHDFERSSRPTPRLCRNVYCGRTLDGASRLGDTRADSRKGQGAGNDVGLCSTCYGPLYVNTYDPEGKALKRRVERRYLSQLVSGCKQRWCRNEFCKTGREAAGNKDVLTTQDALPLADPFISGLKTGTTSLHFCVDEASQKRRTLATMMAAEQMDSHVHRTYLLEWCVAALEAEGGNLERARDWLKNYAPAIQEMQL